MSTASTPGRARPSALPTPGRQISNSGIPAPGLRPRSSASGLMTADSNNLFISTSTTADEMKALSDAIRSNDPSTYRAGSSGLASPALSDSVFAFNGGSTIVARKSLSSRPSLDPKPQRCPPADSLLAAQQPQQPHLTFRTIAQIHARAMPPPGQWEVGDPVRMENLGMEGTLRFLGEIAGKAGTWAGVELLPGFAGKGKNDGSVAGVHYFTCAPQCGVFVMPSKLSLSTVAFPPRAPSVASSRASVSAASGRITPSGRVTPSSVRGRPVPVTPVARKPASASVTKTPVPAMPTPGSRASKYVGMKAKDLSTSKGLSESPTRPNLITTTPRAPKANGLSTPETIALYEERIAQYEDRRYAMEDMIQDLETKLQKYVERPPSPATLARHANAATQIENETLKEQVNHLQHKLSTLEDQMEDMRMMSEKDEQVVNSRISRFRETESTLRAELDTLRKEGEQLIKAEAAARLKVAEVEEAFRENDAALENARAEIETLRTELANLEGTQDDAESGAAEQVAEAAKKASDEKLKLVEQINGLKLAMDQAYAEHKEAADEVEIANKRMVVVNKTADELRARINALESDRSDLEKTLQEEAAKLQLERTRVQELQTILDSKHIEPEASRASPAGSLKELAPRDPRRDSANSISSRTSSRSTNMNSEENLKDQVKGLKHINAELRKENSGLSSQIKVLESEIKIHLAEIEDLRDTTKNLEKTLEEVIEKEEKALADEDGDKSVSKDSEEDPVAIIKSLKAEVEQLQKRLSEVEKEHTKTVHSLNKDILDLEQLVEAKIYREDDLEREIERLNEKISRRRSRKASGDSLRHSAEQTRPSSRGSGTLAVVPPEAEADNHACELCGQPGHDLASCDIVNFGATEPAPTTTTASAPAAEPETTDELDHFCENCEVLGDHVTDDCPYGDDVF
ncbi:hypothetical protein FRB90_012312 [Tulasnella sp. 427]|nr:hypothetical protein FRB90_012312 [Tulasnella sp. 427]